VVVVVVGEGYLIKDLKELSAPHHPQRDDRRRAGVRWRKSMSSTPSIKSSMWVKP